MFCISKRATQRAKEIEKEFKAEFDELMTLYTEVAVGWLLKLWNKPIVSLLVDSSISLDFKSIWGSSSSKLLKIKVRIETILNAIKSSIQDGEMPVPLASFMKSIASKGGYVPKDFFTKFEKNRITLTDRGYLKEANLKEKQVVLGVFLLVRMLVIQILLKPQKNRLRIKTFL